MRKRYLLILLTILMLPLSGCDIAPTFPEDLDAFISHFNIDRAINNHQKGTLNYLSTVLENDVEVGRSLKTYTYEINDKFSAHNVEIMEGSLIPTTGSDANIIYLEETLDNLNFKTIYQKKDEVKVETARVLTENERNLYLQDFFYTTNANGYNGGYYLGDWLKARAALANYMSIDDAKETLTLELDDFIFDEQNDVWLTYRYVVDKDGMILDYYFHAYDEMTTLTTEFTITYN